jgi:hypothetical protein
MLAAIVSGEADLADVLFLAAFICAVVATVVHLVRGAAEAALVPAAVALLALGWLVL